MAKNDQKILWNLFETYENRTVVWLFVLRDLFVGFSSFGIGVEMFDKEFDDIWCFFVTHVRELDRRWSDIFANRFYTREFYS